MPQDKLVILFLAANPEDTIPLKLDEELRAIDQELQKTEFRNRFDLRSALAMRYGDLQGLLLRFKPHIVHFSGHGSEAGEIILKDHGGTSHPVPPAALADLFAILKDNVRCVVLNACFSQRQARGIAKSIDYVVGMKRVVTDDRAIDFAVAFYLGLGYGRSVQDAFALGRNRLQLAGGDHERAPILIAPRSGAGISILNAEAPAIEAAPSKQVTAEPAHDNEQSSQAAAHQARESVVASSQPVVIVPPLDIEWIPVSAGEFLMGSDKAKDRLAKDEEIPQHRVHLSEYHIAKYPITNAQYKEFVKAAGYSAPAHWDRGSIPQGKDRHPVVYVSWHDANAYCIWASQVTGRSIRLPSEAEWEKAARGMTGRTWPWGDQPPTAKLCNFGENVGITTSVDNYPLGASVYGVMDMAGNVLEWTGTLWGSDLHIPQYKYPYDADDGREWSGAPGSVRRVLRGCSYGDGADLVRCAYRGRYRPNLRYDYIGFRVAAIPL